MLRGESTDDRRTATLAEKIMGWKPTPDRFMKSRRSWIPRSRFRPFEDVRDALRLLERATRSYCLSGDHGVITVTVQIGDHSGAASGKEAARTISIALCQALGI